MTNTDKNLFLASFERLVVAFPGKWTQDPGEVKTTMRVYFDTLRDFTLADVEAGERTLRRTGGKFFPSSSAWYTQARDATLRRRMDRPAPGGVDGDRVLSDERRAELWAAIKARMATLGMGRGH